MSLCSFSKLSASSVSTGVSTSHTVCQTEIKLLTFFLHRCAFYSVTLFCSACTCLPRTIWHVASYLLKHSLEEWLLQCTRRTCFFVTKVFRSISHSFSLLVVFWVGSSDTAVTYRTDCAIFVGLTDFGGKGGKLRRNTRTTHIPNCAFDYVLFLEDPLCRHGYMGRHFLRF